MKRDMSPALRAKIAQALGTFQGQAPRLVVPDGQGRAAPVLADQIAVQHFVEQDCGADGYTIQGNKLIAVRFVDGVACTLKTYDIESF